MHDVHPPQSRHRDKPTREICYGGRAGFRISASPRLRVSASFFILWLVSLLLCLPASAADNVFISEFMAVNDSTLADEDGDFSDWIEIHNGGTNSINLDGWFLTD